MSQAPSIPGIAAEEIPQLAQDLYELEIDARTSAECEGQMLEMLGKQLPPEARRQREATKYGHTRKADWLKALREFLAPGVKVAIGRAAEQTDGPCEGRR